MSLIQTKILIPKERKRLLHRRRLVNFLHANIDHKLIMISAPAGYGKTSLLIDFAGDTDLPVCWYVPDENDRNLRDFSDYLLAAIEQVFPGLLTETRRFLNNQAGELRAEPLAGILANDIIQNIPEFFLIILDDYHVVDDIVAINLFLDTFLRYQPENCRLIIASRTIPTLTPRGMALLVASQQVTGLGAQELRFTAEEVRDLIQQNYHHTLTLEQAEEMARECEGWITAILMKWQPMWSGLLGNLSQARGGLTGGVYDFLANEVFQHLDAERREFLKATSIVSTMSVGLCNALVGRDDSQAVLESLHDSNLFITRLERDGQTWYQYHRLFREFLSAKLRSGSAGQEMALHVRAARYLEQAGDAAEAIQHYLEAGMYQDAARLILQQAPAAFDAGRRDALLAWIKALPEEILDRMPRLHWFKAKILLTRDDMAGSLLHAERARAGFEQLKDHVNVAQALIEKSAALLLLGRFSEALDACNIALANLEGLDLQGRDLGVLAGVYRNMGLCHFRSGFVSQAIQELRRALGLYQQVGYLTNLAAIHNDLGGVLRAAGNLNGAHYHFERALALCERDGNLAGMANAMNSIGFTHHLRGEYAQALDMYGLALKKAREIADDRLSAFILAGIGDSHLACGELEQAIRAYEQSDALWHHDAYLHDYLLAALATAHLLNGNAQKASDLARQAFERAQERGAKREVAAYEIVLGIIYYQQGYARRAADYLTKAAETLREEPAQRDLARAQLHLAQAHYRAGRLDQAQIALEHLAESILDLGQDQFLLPESQTALPVLEYASEHAIGGDILTNLFKRAREFRETFLQKCDQLSQTSEAVCAAIPPIRVFALGETRVLRGNEQVTNKEWGALKARQLFFYLLSSPVGFRREQIIQEFWPDASEEKGNGVFHVTTYRLRRALGHNNILVLEDEKYQINRQAPIWYDVWEFDRLLNEADRLEGTQPQLAAERRREAVDLVRGEFCEDLPAMEWQTQARHRLERRWIEALIRLGEYTLAQGDSERALGYFQRVLARDSLREDAHRGVMRALLLAGDRLGALRHYRQVEEHIRQEVGAQPEVETRQLYQQIVAVGETIRL